MWIAAWLQFDKRCQGEQQISARRTEKSDMGMMFGRIVRRKSHWSRWLTQNVCGIASVVTPQKMCFINKYTSWWICKTSIPCRKNMEKQLRSPAVFFHDSQDVIKDLLIELNPWGPTLTTHCSKPLLPRVTSTHCSTMLSLLQNLKSSSNSAHLRGSLSTYLSIYPSIHLSIYTI